MTFRVGPNAETMIWMAPGCMLVDTEHASDGAIAAVWHAHQQHTRASALELVVLEICSALGAWRELTRTERAWCIGLAWAACGFCRAGIEGADPHRVAALDRARARVVRPRLERYLYGPVDLERWQAVKSVGPTAGQFYAATRILGLLPITSTRVGARRGHCTGWEATPGLVRRLAKPPPLCHRAASCVMLCPIQAPIRGRLTTSDEMAMAGEHRE